MSENERLLTCGCCGEELKLIKVTGTYLDYDFTTELKGCESCGFIYIPENLVNTKIAKVEALLEGK